jgi:hypothetical protein
MRYQIVLMGRRGEVDRREVADESGIKPVVMQMIAASGYLTKGDIIKIVDTLAPVDDFDPRFATA